MPSPKVSLIVSTYNWPGALKLCLLSIRNLVVLPDEVIIADDGSGDETLKVIQENQKNFPVPLVHVWHKDEGFRLAKIRNRSIAKAAHDYIVQIDGDLILEKNFIKDHLRFSSPGTFVSGTRVQMSASLSQQQIQTDSIKVSVFSKGITNFSNGLRSSYLSRFFAGRYKANDPTYVRGCNMAFWKNDLVLVNGYNESIVGWGREDSELAIRLINSGIRKQILKFGAVAFHIYHHEEPRKNLARNNDILTEAIKGHIKTCAAGLNQYL